MCMCLCEAMTGVWPPLGEVVQDCFSRLYLCRRSRLEASLAVEAGFWKKEEEFVACWLLNVPATYLCTYLGRICSDKCTCCHTEIEVADQTSQMGMEESQKPESGGPKAERFFFKLKVWKKVSGTLSCFKQTLTIYSWLYFKVFFQRNKAGSDKGFYSKTLYTLNINNKGCTHNHLSFWSLCFSTWAGVVVSNSLMTASRGSFVTVTAPGNKISKTSNDSYDTCNAWYMVLGLIWSFVL